MRQRLVAALVVGFACLAGVARGDDRSDPTGTWKWEVERGGQKREQTLKLKLDAGKLTGHLLGRDNQEIKIEEATFKDGEVSFQVTRERDGQKFTTKYTGKVSGDTIKGKTESERDGQTRTRDWEAKRARE
jgi:hypothetical protein